MVRCRLLATVLQPAVSLQSRSSFVERLVAATSMTVINEDELTASTTSAVMAPAGESVTWMAAPASTASAETAVGPAGSIDDEERFPDTPFPLPFPLPIGVSICGGRVCSSRLDPFSFWSLVCILTGMEVTEAEFDEGEGGGALCAELKWVEHEQESNLFSIFVILSVRR